MRQPGSQGPGELLHPTEGSQGGDAPLGSGGTSCWFEQLASLPSIALCFFGCCFVLFCFQIETCLGQRALKQCTLLHGQLPAGGEGSPLSGLGCPLPAGDIEGDLTAPAKSLLKCQEGFWPGRQRAGDGAGIAVGMAGWRGGKPAASATRRVLQPRREVSTSSLKTKPRLGRKKKNI